MRKVLSIILAITMCMAMTMVSYGANTTYVFDQWDKITTASEESLSDKADKIYDETGIVAAYAVVQDAGSDGSYAYAENIYKENFGNKDGIMLIETETKWSLYKQGEAEDIFDDDDAKEMWSACSSAQYYNEGVEAYLDTVSSLLDIKGVVAEQETTAPETTTDDANHPARLVDGAALLSADEEASLEEKLDEISERQAVDVAVVTTNSLDGKTAEAYGDDYFDYNGYGMGAGDDGIIFVVSMGERQWAISTHGYAITAFTDAGQAYITDTIVPYMSDGDFAWAFESFADLCDDYITQAKTGEPYDVDNMPDDVGLLGCIMWLFPCFGLAAIISLFLKKAKRKSLQTVLMQADASGYWSDFKLTEEHDMFLHRDIVVTEIDNDDDNDSFGGSSTHVSSSGRTHGGSSGSF